MYGRGRHPGDGELLSGLCGPSAVSLYAGNLRAPARVPVQYSDFRNALIRAWRRGLHVENNEPPEAQGPWGLIPTLAGKKRGVP